MDGALWAHSSSTEFSLSTILRVLTTLTSCTYISCSDDFMDFMRGIFFRSLDYKKVQCKFYLLNT